MKITKSLITALGALAFSTLALPAVAQMKGKDTSWYVGGSIGQSRARDVCSIAGFASCDYKDTAWRLLGGYQFSKNWAAEIAFHDLGEAKVPGASVKSNTWDLVGLGMFPIGPVSLYGKLGLYRGHSDCKGCAPDFEETMTNVTWGTGLQYDISQKWALRGEWQRYNNLGGGQFASKFDVDVWSFGGLFRF